MSYVVKYEFLFDRFRAIRQDLIIERGHDDAKCAQIMEIILNFYLLSDYKFFEKIFNNNISD